MSQDVSADNRMDQLNPGKDRRMNTMVQGISADGCWYEMTPGKDRLMMYLKMTPSAVMLAALALTGCATKHGAANNKYCMAPLPPSMRVPARPTAPTPVAQMPVAATSAALSVPAVAPTASEWDKPGYKVIVDDGRLWVFEAGSQALADFEKHGEPAKMVVLPGMGPKGMTLKGTDRDVMLAYALTKPGYKVFVDDGRLWVFETGSQALADFEKHGEPAKMVVLPGMGPKGMTLKGTDRDVMLAYALTKPGYKVIVDDGRLWVFAAGSQALADFEKHGEPAKMVVRPGAGPRGMTLKSVDGAILDAYMGR
jgi:hypothetical protein